MVVAFLLDFDFFILPMPCHDCQLSQPEQEFNIILSREHVLNLFPGSLCEDSCNEPLATSHFTSNYFVGFFSHQ
jgi:hypothetical protein